MHLNVEKFDEIQLAALNDARTVAESLRGADIRLTNASQSFLNTGFGKVELALVLTEVTPAAERE